MQSQKFPLLLTIKLCLINLKLSDLNVLLNPTEQQTKLGYLQKYY